jgi:signal transduction histidine kinase
MPEDPALAEPHANILLVDDQQANLLALEGVLAPLGHRLVQVRSGQDALRALLQQEFAVVLLDVMMPGLDGFDTARLIRQRPKTQHLPIIFITAVAEQQEFIERAYKLGAVDYITKPFVPEVLRAKVSAFVSLFVQQELSRQHLELAAHEREARAVAEAEARSRDELIAVVSHELRTPLNAILGWAEMLSRRHLSPAQEERAIATIVRSARAQAQLIEDLLDLSRIRAGKLRVDRRPMRLAQTISAAIEMVRPLAQGKNVKLESELDYGEYQGDAQRLQQVALNLINNALKFTAAGGRIDVRLRRHADSWELRVEDTGAGIEPEFLPRMFELFTQSSAGADPKHGGLGLGLAIVKYIVNAHGGDVSVESAGLGQGATFIVRLPATEMTANPGGESLGDSADAATTRERAAISDGGEQRLDGMRVLVVDDEKDSREMLATIFADAGALVELVDSAGRALEAVGRTRFNIVVSDISMPGEDGWTLARRLHGVVPAVAVSALDSPDDQARSLEAGYVSHVGKPVRAEELIGLVWRLAQTV